MSEDRAQNPGVEPGEDEPRRSAELAAALDALDEKVRLLVGRSRRLADRFREEEQLRERLEGGLDPVALNERVHALESENDRLSRHAEFLERQFKELLSRVRYVVEA
jgi:chaperonin cofactor prefoldin